MNLTVTSVNNNLVFNGKMTKFSKEYMDRVLLPMFNGNVDDFQTMFTKSGYTKSAVSNWFKKTFGMSIEKYKNSLKKDELKREMEDFFRQGVPIREVAKHYGRSKNWVNKRYVEFGLKHQSVHIDEKEQEKILAFIKAGYVVEYVAEKFKRSVNTIQRLIDIHFKGGLVKYRHDNNITIKHKRNNAELEQVAIVRKCFQEGKSIKETANIIKRTSQRVLYLKEKYNLKSESDIAHERMDKLLPQMIEQRLGIRKMVEEIGLSPQTIRRRIKELYGKTYLDIRTGK